MTPAWRWVLAILALVVSGLTSAATDSGTSCGSAPLNGRDIYLRGTFNNWSTQDVHRLAWRCDHFEAIVQIEGQHSFKLADEDWSADADWGAPDPQTDTPRPLQLRGPSMSYRFGGNHRIVVNMPSDSTAPSLSISRSAVGPGAAAADDALADFPLARLLRFDSRELAYKAPFGAVPAGTTVRFALDAPPQTTKATLVVERRQLEGNQEVLQYHELARIPMTRATSSTDGGGVGRWQAPYAFATIGVYGYYFEAVIDGQIYRYQNNNNAVFWTREKGSMGLGRAAPAQANRKAIRRFRQTVYAPDFTVPTWARDAVYYAIFPERFRNGNPANDPSTGVATYQDKPVENHNHWNDVPYKPGSGDGSDAVYNNDFFGGDIQGIIDKLDYIADLGANTLYITPLFQAASNHKYDTSNYQHIDAGFGTDDDFSRLARAAAKRGMRVIPDTSLNHVGSDSVYFDRFGKHGGDGAFFGGKVNPRSPYADWFSFDTHQSDPDKQYKGWVGVLDLPELNKASRSFRQFAYGAPDSIMKRWLDLGAAGWRMDVAPWVPDDFWREWRAAIKQHKPDALTIAETWFDASKYFLGDSFDSTMNYIFRDTVLAYARGGDARALYENIELMREAYPTQAFQAVMNLISSHDQARALHVLGHQSLQDGAPTITLAKQRLRLAALFQMLLPGAPSIYYGDEVGLAGGDDPYNRAPYPWADQGGLPDTALLDDYKRFIALRQRHPVLRHGSLSAPLHLDAHVIVLARQDGAQWAITATNNDSVAHALTIQLPSGAPTKTWVERLGGATAEVNNGQLSLTVPPLSGGAWIP